MSEWQAELLVKMRINKITQQELARHVGWSYQYVNMIFNGRKSPQGAREKLTNGVAELIEIKKTV